MIDLVTQALDTEAMLRQVASPEAGAVVFFLGTARRFTDGHETLALDYECFAEMAKSKLAELELEARRRWPIVECVVIHRIGHVPVGEASVGVAVSTAHRQAAFDAAQWLINTVKEVVPIWKQEHWADGTTQWVHPGLAVPKQAKDTP